MTEDIRKPQEASEETVSEELTDAELDEASGGTSRTAPKDGTITSKDLIERLGGTPPGNSRRA